MLILILLIFSTNSMAQATEGETAYVSWSPDGTILAVGYDMRIDILDSTSQEILNSFQDIEVVASPAWSPDGSKLAFANSTDVEVWANPWNSATAQRLMTYKYYPVGTPPGQLVPIADLVWSPDGTKIASAAGSAIDIWNVSTGQLNLLMPISPVVWDIVPDLTWSFDNRMAIANLNGTVLVLNPQTGEAISGFRSRTSFSDPTVLAVDFSPDGNQLVLGTGEGFVQIWGDTRTPNVFTQQPSFSYNGHNNKLIYTVDWNPLGQYIASGDYFGHIRVWDATTGAESLAIDLGEDVVVNSVAWSPDGTQLAYTDAEGQVQIIAAPETAITPTPTS